MLGVTLQVAFFLMLVNMMSEMGLPVFSFLSPTQNQSLQNLKSSHFLTPLCTPVQGLDLTFNESQQTAIVLWGRQTECLMSCPWNMWCSGKSHRLPTTSGDDCELVLSYPWLAQRGRGQSPAFLSMHASMGGCPKSAKGNESSCRGFPTLSEGMGCQRL